jgi:hypothetical protein
MFKSLLSLGIVCLISSSVFSQDSIGIIIIGGLRNQLNDLNTDLTSQKNQLEKARKDNDSLAKKIVAKEDEFQKATSDFDNDRKVFDVNLAKKNAHIDVLYDSLKLIQLYKQQCEASNSSNQIARDNLSKAIHATEDSLRISNAKANNANKKVGSLKITVAEITHRQDSILVAQKTIENNLIRKFQTDTAAYRQESDSLVEAARQERDIAKGQLERANANKFTAIALFITTSCIASYILWFFFFQTKKIIQEARKKYRFEYEAVLKDTLIRYYYYNKTIRFIQSLLLISIVASVVYAIILFIILVQTSDIGASLKELLAKDSLATLGTLATPLIFSITLYGFVEAKIQDNARLISDLRKM